MGLPSERKALSLIIWGLNDKEIACPLGLTVRTVDLIGDATGGRAGEYHR